VRDCRVSIVREQLLVLAELALALERLVDALEVEPAKSRRERRPREALLDVAMRSNQLQRPRVHRLERARALLGVDVD